MRTLALLCVLLVACVPTAPTAPPRQAAPDIQRSKIDIVFSGLIGGSYYKPNGRDLLVAALEAIKKEARDTRGDADAPTPAFDGSEEKQLADFRLFAAAAEQLAAKNPQLSPSRISGAAIRAMLRLNPDCHNYYRPSVGGASLLAQTHEDGEYPRSGYYVPGRAGSLKPGLAAPHRGSNGPADGDAQIARYGQEAGTLGSGLGEAGGLQARLLPGHVGYLSWRSFMDPAVFDDVRRALDRLLAQGARSWLFDLRDNGGGDGPMQMVSWFVNGGTIWREVDRDGSLTPATARPEFFLPPEYQLPIAIVINGRTGSSPEFFTLALQQRGRAKVFGTKSVGCLGSTALSQLPDGTVVSITQSVVIGPTSDAPVNNVGITPDVEVSGDVVEVAAAYLRSLVR